MSRSMIELKLKWPPMDKTIGELKAWMLEMRSKRAQV